LFRHLNQPIFDGVYPWNRQAHKSETEEVALFKGVKGIKEDGGW